MKTINTIQVYKEPDIYNVNALIIGSPALRGMLIGWHGMTTYNIAMSWLTWQIDGSYDGWSGVSIAQQEINSSSVNNATGLGSLNEWRYLAMPEARHVIALKATHVRWLSTSQITLSLHHHGNSENALVLVIRNVWPNGFKPFKKGKQGRWLHATCERVLLQHTVALSGEKLCERAWEGGNLKTADWRWKLCWQLPQWRVWAG